MRYQNVLRTLRFKGQWRSYQKRVLDRAENYLKDKKIHIVAAPGSGKTTLGIELIRRLGRPALILSPSINIRNQWIARIEEAYLPEGTDTAGLLSNTIRNPALITAITYQALHSCMRGVRDEQGDAAETDVDFFEAIHSSGVKTLCLDEAHHLRSKWWRALEELREKEPDMTVISLTATPPYDASKGEWDKYIGLCGPIDEEIIVPELVKEGSLCPHQDYVYFNMPTKEEADAVETFRKDAASVAEQIFEDEEFAAAIQTHAGLRQPMQHAEQLLEKPEYLSSLLVFLNARKLPFSRELLHMLGAGDNIPQIDLHWLEVLLQGFLYEDPESFSCEEKYREKLQELLKGHGLIQKRKVVLTADDQVDKTLVQSKGKIRSIVILAGEEYKNLGEKLRLLILTDYIKKEYMPALGNKDKSVNELGVVPIFENIRRAYEETPVGKELRLAALSGSIVLIPDSAKETLTALMSEKGVGGSIKECVVPGYYQVSVSGSEETASGLVTEAFNRGDIRVLVGTKSLLGEGWDSPCINSLILASFVGSFMLSNQMRGRAIRVMKQEPDKVSNIWHLVCMEPEEKGKKLKGPGESADFATLKRRFEGFLGVNYEKDVIENGLERLSFIRPPYTAESLEKINEKMLSAAGDREGLRRRWKDSLTVLRDMDLAVEAGADKNYFKPGFQMYSALILMILCGIAAVFCIGALFGILALNAGGSRLGNILLVVLTILLTAAIFRYGGKVLCMATPMGYMRSIGRGVLAALRETGAVLSRDVSVEAEDSGGFMCYVYLKNGTEREKDVFAQCMCEMFGEVDNQRYLLKARRPVPKICKYYCVPELFGRKKEDAVLFAGKVGKYIGAWDLIYTRSEAGRKQLLEARIHSFVNKSGRCTGKSKKVKSPWT